jgi:hypothetical protein
VTIICDILFISLIQQGAERLAYRYTTCQLIPNWESNKERVREAYPNEASCQLMKHSIAVFQLRLDGGDRYVAPIIANR